MVKIVFILHHGIREIQNILHQQEPMVTGMLFCFVLCF